MTKILKISGLALLMMLSVTCLAIDSDTVILAGSKSAIIENSNLTEYDDTFFKAGLATMTLLFLLIFCILTIIGVIITTIVILAILGLGFAGIVSTSAIYGIYKKSLEKAFKTFTILSFVFCGFLFCAIVFPIVNKIMHWTAFENALLAGIITGIMAGLVTGLIVFKILKVLTEKFVKKFNLKQEEPRATL